MADAKRYDLTVARETGEGKTFWTRIGTAFPNKEGGGFSLIFDAHPVGDRCSMFLHKDREPGDDDGPPAKGGAKGYGGRR